MKKAAAHSATTITNTNSTHLEGALFGKATRVLFATLWRIVLPVVVFATIGRLLDNAFMSDSWLTLVGVALGLVVATVLIKHQKA